MHRVQFSQRNSFLGNKLGECFLIRFKMIELSGDEERLLLNCFPRISIRPELNCLPQDDPILLKEIREWELAKKSTFNLHISQGLPDKAIKERRIQ